MWVVAADAYVVSSASIGPYVVIESGATIEADVVIGAQSFVGARSRIGAGGRLAPRVTLYHDVQIGKRVVIQSGAVIGGEGFGFAKEKRSEEHTSELQSLMRISYAVFCLKKKKRQSRHTTTRTATI